MMKPLLSLKLLCSQAVAIRLCWNLQQQKIGVELRQCISTLEVPKTLETGLLEIGIAMVPELQKLIMPLKYVNGCFYLLDSSLLSLSPTGGINFEETIVNILKQPHVDQVTKLLLENRFYMSDISYNLRYPNLKSMSDEILSHIENMNIPQLRCTWKILSQNDKEQLLRNMDNILLCLRRNSSGPVCDFLMDNLLTEKTRNFWKLYGSEDPVDEFCFDNQLRRFLDYLASPFCYLHRNFTTLAKELDIPNAAFAHILRAMITRIARYYDNVLYQYLNEIWNDRSDSFRQKFCSENNQFLHDLLHKYGRHNLEFAFQIFLLLEPFIPKLKVDTTPNLLGRHLCNFLKYNKPFSPPDNYLKKFVCSEDKIARLKKKAIWMHQVRFQILCYMRKYNSSVIANEIIQWALATQEERDKYRTAFEFSF